MVRTNIEQVFTGCWIILSTALVKGRCSQGTVAWAGPYLLSVTYVVGIIEVNAAFAFLKLKKKTDYISSFSFSSVALTSEIKYASRTENILEHVFMQSYCLLAGLKLLGTKNTHRKRSRWKAVMLILGQKYHF